MASLDQFDTTTTSSIDDFKVDVHNVAPVSNRPSNINLAAHAASMVNDPSSVMKAFSASNAELDMTGKSQTDTCVRTRGLANNLVPPSTSSTNSW